MRCLKTLPSAENMKRAHRKIVSEPGSIVFHIDQAALQRIYAAFFNTKKRIVDRTNLAMLTLLCNKMITARYRLRLLNNY